MNPLDWIGHVAGVCTTMAFLPQVIKVWRTRSVDDISRGMYSLFVFGVALWLLYGVVINSWPLMIPNAITLVLAGSVLVMKLRYTARKKP
ncbi:SemiSWEET transporter [Jeongeupia wiesaeckerbachi]|uniref:SemiSWEET transporter n=1 Tax=Jeongeupia wiesaeckerbachi TaxID=3051218 RepID=UPI003D807BBD